MQKITLVLAKTGLLLIAALFGSALKLFAGVQQPADSLSKVLTARENEMFTIVTTGDKPAAEKLFSADYITVNADGVMETKEQVMKTFGKFKGSTFRLSDRKIRAYADVAVINGRAKFYIKSVLVAEVFYTEIWVYRQGAWGFAGWQGTMTGLPSWYPVIVTAFLLLLFFTIVWLVRRRKRRNRERAR